MRVVEVGHETGSVKSRPSGSGASVCQDTPPSVVPSQPSPPCPDPDELQVDADVESGVCELKSCFGLYAFRKHGFMANWAWLLVVCLGQNLCRRTPQLGHLEARRDGRDL
ncbi:MAG TPA: hypothetical protein VN886_06840, partial [Acidimicrobiales bacterium]|nr:hypothetical protein [Acidimicrobiales bacterium]